MTKEESTYKMIDAKTYNVAETLRNGMDVTIRAIRADDKEALL
jgi:hypothetical protein